MVGGGEVSVIRDIDYRVEERGGRGKGEEGDGENIATHDRE